MNKELNIVVGISGSGKTTYCTTKVNDLESEGVGAVRVSADDYPGLYVGGVLNVRKLQLAHDECFEHVKVALEEDKKVFLDNTNIDVQHWRRYLELCVNLRTPVFFHFPIDILYFYVPKESSLRQNRECQLRRAIELRARGAKVIPENVIKTMETKFMATTYFYNSNKITCGNDPNKWLRCIPAETPSTSRKK